MGGWHVSGVTCPKVQTNHVQPWHKRAMQNQKENAMQPGKWHKVYVGRTANSQKV